MIKPGFLILLLLFSCQSNSFQHDFLDKLSKEGYQLKKVKTLDFESECLSIIINHNKPSTKVQGVLDVNVYSFVKKNKPKVGYYVEVIHFNSSVEKNKFLNLYMDDIEECYKAPYFIDTMQQYIYIPQVVMEANRTFLNEFKEAWFRNREEIPDFHLR